MECLIIEGRVTVRENSVGHRFPTAFQSQRLGSSI